MEKKIISKSVISYLVSFFLCMLFINLVRIINKYLFKIKIKCIRVKDVKKVTNIFLLIQKTN